MSVVTCLGLPSVCQALSLVWGWVCGDPHKCGPCPHQAPSPGQVITSVIVCGCKPAFGVHCVCIRGTTGGAVLYQSPTPAATLRPPPRAQRPGPVTEMGVWEKSRQRRLHGGEDQVRSCLGVLAWRVRVRARTHTHTHSQIP